MHSADWTPSQPLDLAACTDRYRRWGDDGANRVIDGSFYRVCAAGPYRAIQHEDGRIRVESPLDAESCLADLRHRLGGSMSRSVITELAAEDQVVGRLWRSRPGYAPPVEPDSVESLAKSVTAQQVNLAWATTTRRRLVELLGLEHRVGPVEVWAFPTAAALARTEPEALRRLQFTTAKSEYLVNIARAAVDGHLEGLEAAVNEEVIERLTRIRGVGRWTADWYLARCLGRPDAVAATDLGVRKAIGTIYLRGEVPAAEADVRAIAAQWGRAANWATHLLLEELAARRDP